MWDKNRKRRNRGMTATREVSSVVERITPNHEMAFRLGHDLSFSKKSVVKTGVLLLIFYFLMRKEN